MYSKELHFKGRYPGSTMGKSTPTPSRSPSFFICKMKSTLTPANGVSVRTRDEKGSARSCALYRAGAPEMSSLQLLVPNSCTHTCQVPGLREKGKGYWCRLAGAQVLVRERAECCCAEHSHARATGPSPVALPKESTRGARSLLRAKFHHDTAISAPHVRAVQTLQWVPRWADGHDVLTPSTTAEARHAQTGRANINTVTTKKRNPDEILWAPHPLLEF